MKSSDSILSSVIWVIACICFAVGIAGCPMQPQEKLPEGAQTGVEFIQAYKRELATVFNDAAILVRSGTIKTDVELLEHLQSKTENARKRAAEPMGVLLEKRLSNGELKPEDAAVLLELATGLGK